MQAPIGCAQLEKLPGFVAARRQNWQSLRDGLADLADRFILPEPTVGSEPAWFGFLLTVRQEAGFTRDQAVGYLERKGMRQPPRQRVFTPDRVMARLRAPLSLLRATKCKADLWNQL